MLYKKLLVFIILIGIFLPGSAFTQQVTKTGTTAAKFLSIGIGPRAISMGGAFTSIANDASAIYWNPAGIAYTDQFQGFFTNTSLFAGISLNYVGLIVPGGDVGNFAASVTAVNYGSIPVTTETQPEGTGESFRLWILKLGYPTQSLLLKILLLVQQPNWSHKIFIILMRWGLLLILAQYSEPL